MCARSLPVCVYRPQSDIIFKENQNQKNKKKEKKPKRLETFALRMDEGNKMIYNIFTCIIYNPRRYLHLVFSIYIYLANNTHHNHHALSHSYTFNKNRNSHSFIPLSYIIVIYFS